MPRASRATTSMRNPIALRRLGGLRSCERARGVDATGGLGRADGDAANRTGTDRLGHIFCILPSSGARDECHSRARTTMQNEQRRSAKRALRDRLGRALNDLRAEPISDTCVHEARKELKRARATVRLLRDAI